MIHRLLVSILIVSQISGCTFFSRSNRSLDISESTGWNLDHTNMVREVAREQKTAPGLVFIEGGTFTMGRSKDDVLHDWNNSPSKQHVRSFYMDETEVTNASYLEYLKWIESVFSPSDERYAGIHQSILPDTMVWRDHLSQNEVYVENYLRHPAYLFYPVVGVNWLQATRYADWRTDRVNERVLIKSRYITNRNIIDRGLGATTNKKMSNAVYGKNHFSSRTYLYYPNKVVDNVYDKNPDSIKVFQVKDLGVEGEGISNIGSSILSLVEDPRLRKRKGVAKREHGILLPEYRLPTEAEWEYAALALKENREYNSYLGKKIRSRDLRKSRGSKKGAFLANFKRGRGDYSGIAGWGNDGADITTETKSFRPNPLGLYDMEGNVAEWVADAYRPIIDDQANDFNYYRGNVFKKVIREDGGTAIINKEVQYDTLPNGKLVYKNLPGEILYEQISDKDVYLKPNIQKAYNIDYRDGDIGSQKGYYGFNDEHPRMYNSPDNKVRLDKNGDIETELDKNNYRTSGIGDEIRVIKGGSWKDRSYWLDPSERRFMPEYESASWIGFRCAMDRVGPMRKKNSRRTKR